MVSACVSGSVPLCVPVWYAKGCKTNVQPILNKKLKGKPLESVGENEELTEKRRLFCLHYAMSHNATQAYLKTYGGDKIAAAVQGCRLLRNVKVADEVQRLQKIMRRHLDVGVPDLVQYFTPYSE